MSDSKQIYGATMNDAVCIIRTTPEYPPAPFSASVKYPEYGFDDLLPGKNHVYEAVRNLLVCLKLDEKNIGTKYWNPLKNIIKPDNTVLIKPNMVNSVHFGGGNLFSVITHGSVLRAVIDYVLIALRGTGRIVIADSPERMANFGKILKADGVSDLARYYNKVNKDIEVIDLRRERIKYGFGAIVERKKIEGDPQGYTIVNIGKHSAFYGLPNERLNNLYGADYNRRETLAHHVGSRHEYEISNSVLKSDVIISVPKLKTHHKAGVTLNLKGFIGCTGNKNLIPHRTLGDPSNGGDSYPYPASTKRGYFVRRTKDFLKDRLLAVAENRCTALLYGGTTSALVNCLRPPKGDLKYGGGEWYGNDTLWRSVLDVARVIFYADKKGTLCAEKQRKFVCIVDGIYAGDRKGPIEPRMRKEGVVIGGFDPVLVDIACTRLMGLDWKKIRYLKEASRQHKYDLSVDAKNAKVISNENRFEHLFGSTRNETLCFEPAEMWKGQIELP